MIAFYWRVIFLVTLLAIGIGATFIGILILDVIDEAIGYWMTRRQWVCFEHSGEFDTLFKLRDLGVGLTGIGLLLCVSSMFLLTHFHNISYF